MPEIANLEPGLVRLQAHSDDQLLGVWLHGRSCHTQRAYATDVARFRAGAGKPLTGVTLADLQRFTRRAWPVISP